MSKSISLRAKLSIAFAVLTVLVTIAGIYQVRSISHIRSMFDHLGTSDVQRRQTLGDLKAVTKQIEIETLRYDQDVTDKPVAADPVKEKSIIATYERQMNDLLSRYTKDKDSQHPRNDGSLNVLGARISNLAQSANAYIDAVGQQSAAQISAKRTTLEEHGLQLQASIDDITKIEETKAATEASKVADDVDRLVQIVILMIAGIVLFSALLGVIGIGLFTRAINLLKQGAQRIANGDFSRRIPVKTHDEIGQLAESFNNMAERLRDSYRRLSIETEQDRILLESLGEGVIAIDEKTNITLINNQAIDMLELGDKPKLIGLPVNHALTLLDDKGKPLAGAQTPVVQAVTTQQAVRSVYSYKKSGGIKMMLDISANPVLVEDKLSGAIMNLRDVTKEKEIDRMKTEFISLASHQLRTPLSAIKWFTEMLVSGDAGKLTTDQAEFAKNIGESTERMIALVNALLNISRIESGRIMIDPKPTDLRDLVAGIVNDLKAKTEEKQQTLIISVHEDLPKIKLDARLIGQVYLNLLTNAVKYTPKGGEISVFISKKDDQVISQIADNGYGIPKEQQGRIFQKFFRASNAVKVETDGTGLGLYLIKAVVESSGGKIWFKSEEGKGTTFWFSIPLSGMKAKEGEVTLDV